MNFLIWKIKNIIARMGYKPQQLLEEELKLINKMRADGFVHSLSLSRDELDHIQNEARQILQNNQDYKKHIENKIPVGMGKAKEWIYSFNPLPNGPIMKFTRSDSLKRLANAYLGMDAVLTEAHLGLSIPGDQNRGSNIWHRDRGDYRYFRVFIYLDDITESTGGQVSYVPTSQYGGKLNKVFSNKRAMGIKIKEDMKLSAIDFYGKAGTIIFADTSGIHRNGLAKNPTLKVLIVFATRGHSRYREYAQFKNA